MTTATMFTPLTLGTIGTLQNRFAMAAMTRARADNNEKLPNDLIKEYYVQRKSAGLILTEGTHISPNGIGWVDVPGIWNEAQAAKWKEIVDEVQKDNGARMVVQLWHQGRQSHETLVEGDMGVVAPSAIAAKGEVHLRDGKEPYPVPRALELEEIPKVIEEYVNAAKMAKKAGFSGIEIHSANGYLLDTFIQSKTNKRTDKYGGSIENRLRIVDEILTAVKEVYPASAIGIKLSPNGAYGDMGSEDNIETFTEAIKLAAKHELAFIEVVDGLAFGFHELTEPFTLDRAQSALKEVQGDKPSTVIMGNCGYTFESAEEAVSTEKAGLISFGRPFINNPDLVERFKETKKLNEAYDPSKWFIHSLGADGFTDFPSRD